MKTKHIEELEKKVNPNTWIVLTVRQGIQNDMSSFIPGSYLAYERAMKGFWNEVNRRLYGKRKLRRRKRIIPNITVLERSYGGMWHIHACAKRPPHVTIEEFRQIVDDCCRRSRWFLPRREVEDYRGGGVSYILKDGQDGILVQACCF
ncbi:hypothetical protein JW805_04020 [Roseomonas aeriglobus]|nr:hypothetical protein [Roseomonas aeriglobus]